MFRLIFGASGLFLLASCGAGLCRDQASCPDGSWTAEVPVLLTPVDLLASNMLRDKTAGQLGLKAELALGSAALPSGYRYVPDIMKDDDGLGGSVTLGTRPSVVCGTTQKTVELRVADCALANSDMATWDGASNGHAGEGQWKLVTYNGTHEVWRDERTKLIWSDNLGTTNWCRASGSSGGGPFGQVDPNNICDNIANQPVQAVPESWCTEHSAFNTPATYDSAKGGMRLAATSSSPSVIWRLPTRADFFQAEVDGFRFPLPNMNVSFWTATTLSYMRNAGWIFGGASGGHVDGGYRYTATYSVRCVGR